MKTKTYRLYRRNFRKLTRGKQIATFPKYKDLVASAKARTIGAGYPESAWMDLFDWSLD